MKHCILMDTSILFTKHLNSKQKEWEQISFYLESFVYKYLLLTCTLAVGTVN